MLLSSPAAPRPAAWLSRSTAALLTAVIIVSLAAAPTQARRRVDLTPAINSLQHSQRVSEAAMMRADRQLRSLRRERKRLSRKIVATEANLARVRGIAADRRSEREAARAALFEALSSLGSPSVAEVVGAVTVLGQPLLDPRGDEAVDTSPSMPSGLPIPVSVVETRVPQAPPSAGQIAALRASLKEQRRATRKAERRVRKAAGKHRAKLRRLRTVKRLQHGALARRAAGEAALKRSITAMSALAHRRALRKTKVRPGRNTRFIWPTRGRITQPYGCTGSIYSPRRGSCSGFHDGIDIAAARGTPIRAAAVGVISYVGRNPWDRGKRAFIVVLAHPGGWETLYAHVLPIRRVKAGDLVHKGDRIAHMGSTGHSSGVHLHLELRRGRTTLNPLSYLS